MSPNLPFWLFAAALFASFSTCALLGWRRARQGRLEDHRRLMGRAIGLVLLFVVCYLIKLLVAGREDLGGFSRAEIVVLRIHESLVGLMVVAGTLTRVIARAAGTLGAPHLPAKEARRHRFWGRVTLISAGLALLTATIVLRALGGR